MMYLVALIAVVVIAVLCWKAFGPERSGPPPRSPRRKQIMGPDDDPDFLWRISRQQHRDGEGDR
ncbi:hypothetical protein [Nocardia bovistercoris]|uniref:Uncharacterized protein n=1 Tax=Nocardia bovistercoris TaxID=2785916 RepID=A0A931N443_9NOCA|nr:hypothetical protein [Nocardia bovistercoris]